MKKYVKLENKPLPLSCDVWLDPYRGVLDERRKRTDELEKRLCLNTPGGLAEFAQAYKYFGLHREADDSWVFREYAPHAGEIFLIGDFSGWEKKTEFRLKNIGDGKWEGRFPPGTFHHLMHYALEITGAGRRIPAYAVYVTQDRNTNIFTARVWDPDKPYKFKYRSPDFKCGDPLLIYESHVGMAQEEPKVGSFAEYREKILPYIARSRYNTIQLMAVMSHPYYGSFGYHVANFFSIAGIFGTPDEFKALVDEAHRLGIRVIIDLVHSHSVKNENEGLARFDGERSTYFHAGSRGEHSAWDSLCFDYGKTEVLHFLLSNCRFFLEEYNLDGFRFDGVTSMLYYHHGLNKAFTSYQDYFDGSVDEDALSYLTLANRLIHRFRPEAITVAEDVSGLPGLAAADHVGFDYRMAMGVSDMWFKLFDIPDEYWDMGYLYSELLNRRRDERAISYVECHDQAIVGGQTAFFRLAGAEMYTMMNKKSPSLKIDRAMALHKISRALTAATADSGYLCFMGNEFGHPEWVDFPREGNNWSYHYARRQWSLAWNGFLRYGELLEFDRAMLEIFSQKDYYRSPVVRLAADNERKVIGFARGEWFFAANLHPEKSWCDLELLVPPGEYELLMNTDEERFGGFGRIASGQKYFSRRQGLGASGRDVILLYLPARTMIFLKKSVFNA